MILAVGIVSIRFSKSKHFPRDPGRNKVHYCQQVLYCGDLILEHLIRASEFWTVAEDVTLNSDGIS
jgi:hypothetical protein